MTLESPNYLSYGDRVLYQILVNKKNKTEEEKDFIRTMDCQEECFSYNEWDEEYE